MNKARNEPDFYETTNIIISNEKQDTWEDDSTSVHKINISPLEAHDKFNSIKGLNSDFVGKLGFIYDFLSSDLNSSNKRFFRHGHKSSKIWIQSRIRCL